MLSPHQRKPQATRVLVVDDDEMVLVGLSAGLENDGFEVTTSTSSHAALEELSRGSFALVITDMMMPGPSGIAVLERVQATTPRTPVVVLSGFPLRSLAQEALRKGAKEFLAKPIPYATLRKTMRSLLRDGAELADE